MSHYIEELARVYLRLSEDGSRWEIDPVTHDGAPLFGYDDGPAEVVCECDDEASHDEALRHARELDLPTADELATMLAEALGGRYLTPDQAARLTMLTKAASANVQGYVDLNEKVDRGEYVDSSEYHDLDDTARGIAHDLTGL